MSTTTAISPATVRKAIRRAADPRHAVAAQRFFKTGPGEYGEGDLFHGVRMPILRKMAQQYRHAPARTTTGLIQSRYHEERLLGLLILVLQYRTGTAQTRERIYNRYLRLTRHINNWDLVDSSAEHIVGAHLWKKPRDPLYRLAASGSLWERRIAILSTFHFIKRNEFTDTLKLARVLLADDEDLLHKAVGWMLREVGNRNRQVEEAFLLKHYRRMPRTMLRYAIERFPETRRRAFMAGTA